MSNSNDDTFVYVPAYGQIVTQLRSLPGTAVARQELIARNKNKKNHVINYDGINFEIFENVFSPEIFESTKLFTDRLTQGDIDFVDKDMLEMGCGSGLTGLLLMKKFAMRSLMAVDISPDAIACTRHNARALGLEEKVTAIQSDVFDSIPKNNRFDIIYWNHPWVVAEANHPHAHVFELSIFDPGYRALQHFLRDARNYLNPNGRIYLGFGDFGDTEALENLRSHFKYEMTDILKVPRHVGGEKGVAHFILRELTPI